MAMNHHNKIYLLFFFFILSCKEDTLVDQIADDFQVTIEDVNIIQENNQYYILFEGNVHNNSQHFLNNLDIRPKISFYGDGITGSVELSDFRLVTNTYFDKGDVIEFKEKMIFKSFNNDYLRYDLNKANLEIYVRGSNSTGYIIGDNLIRGQDNFVSYPLITHSIKKEFDNIKINN